MCISNYGGFKRMIKFCKTRVTDSIMESMEKLKDNAEGVKAYGIQLGIQICRRLTELGAPGLHFYTLNTAAVTIAILEGLQYAPVIPDDAQLLQSAEVTQSTPAHVFVGMTA